MELPVVKHKKGLTAVFAADAEYCGFDISFNKYGFEIKLGFAMLRILFVSESMYNRLITVTTLKDSPSHEVTIVKPNEHGVFDESAPRL
jgi:hypothetical protein